MGKDKWKWLRNGNVISLLIGALGAGLVAAYEYWATEDLKVYKRKKRKKGGQRRGTKKVKKIVRK